MTLRGVDMNMVMPLADSEADTTPPLGPPTWTPVSYQRALRHQQRRQTFVLFAVAVVLGALVVGMVTGGVVALLV